MEAIHPNNMSPVARQYSLHMEKLYKGALVKPKTNEVSMHWFGVPLETNPIGEIPIASSAIKNGVKGTLVMMPFKRVAPFGVIIPQSILFRDFDIDRGQIGGVKSYKLRRHKSRKHRKSRKSRSGKRHSRN